MDDSEQNVFELVRSITNKCITSVEPKQVPVSGSTRPRDRGPDQTAPTTRPLTPTAPVDLSWGSSSNILNLSTLFQPTLDQIKLLEMGLTFIPTPPSFDREELRRDLYQYHRRIKLLDHFDNSNQNVVPFTLPSSWEPTWEQLDARVKTLIRSDLLGIDSFVPPPATDDGDLRKYKQIISTLQSNCNIIIKPADKGSKTVILDVQQYALEASRQLNNSKHYKQYPVPHAHSHLRYQPGPLHAKSHHCETARLPLWPQ